MEHKYVRGKYKKVYKVVKTPTGDTVYLRAPAWDGTRENQVEISNVISPDIAIRAFTYNPAGDHVGYFPAKRLYPICSAVAFNSKAPLQYIHTVAPVCQRRAGAYSKHNRLGYCGRHETIYRKLKERVKELAGCVKDANSDTMPTKVINSIQRLAKPTRPVLVAGVVQGVRASMSDDSKIWATAEHFLQHPELMELKISVALLQAYLFNKKISELSPQQISVLVKTLTQGYLALHKIDFGNGEYIHINVVYALVRAFAEAIRKFIPDPKIRAAMSQYIETSTRAVLEDQAVRTTTTALLSKAVNPNAANTARLDKLGDILSKKQPMLPMEDDDAVEPE